MTLHPTEDSQYSKPLGDEGHCVTAQAPNGLKYHLQPPLSRYHTSATILAKPQHPHLCHNISFLLALLLLVFLCILFVVCKCLLVLLFIHYNYITDHLIITLSFTDYYFHPV